MTTRAGADRRVAEVFEAAAELDPGARAAFLDAACRSDPAVRREVESLLAWLDRTRTDGLLPPLLGAPDDDRRAAGERVGPYTLVRQIGEGGMGVVYEARREDVEKTVALKLVRHGRLAAPDDLRRFHQERRLLARLEHPHVARLLDAGATESGLPYLVMEYVRGEPIDRYCDARRLPVEARLALVAQVCDAVHDAHAHRVVHRDLKPSNILVTGDGAVKLLDFGIAALLEEHRDETGRLTAPGRAVLTPEYAAPEQLLGEPATPATDVYALGLLLYELLSGHRPFRRAARSTPELLRAVCDETPERPSRAVRRTDARTGADGATEHVAPETVAAARRLSPPRLGRRLAGDLDAIVLTALRKEPERRYPSARALREDLDRHLAGLPVRARGDSLGYRARKFVRRHRAGAAAGGLVAVLLATRLLEVSVETRDRSAERAAAEQRVRDVRALAGALVRADDAVSDVAGALPARAALARRTLDQLRQLERGSAADPVLRREIAAAYVKLGLLQGGPTGASLGDLAAARGSFARALAISEALVAAAPADAAARRTLALAHEKMSDVEAWAGRLTPGIAHARRALAEWQRLAAASPTSAAARRAEAMSRLKLGDLLGSPNLPSVSDRAGAGAQYRVALALMRTLPRDSLADWGARRLLALVHERLGALLHAEGRHAEAVATFEQALGIRSALVRERGASVDARRDLAVAHQLLCEAQLAGGDPGGAVARCRRGLALYAALHAADPQNVQAARDLASGHLSMHKALAARGAPAAALAELARSGALAGAILRSHAEDVVARRDLARARLYASVLHAALAARPGAASHERRAHRRRAAASYDEGARLMAGPPGAGEPAREDAALLAQARAALGGGAAGGNAGTTAPARRGA